MKTQITIETILNAHGLKWVKEHKFHDKRKFRFDYAVIDIMLAIEYEGGTWSGGHIHGESIILQTVRNITLLRLTDG